MDQDFASILLGQDIIAALQKGLGYFKSAEGLDHLLRDDGGLEAKAWPVFTLTLPDVLGNGFQALGVPAGWRIAARFENQVIAGDIYIGNTVSRKYPYSLAAGAPRLACIRRGEEISKMLDTIEQFSKPGVRVHILLLPGLVTDALWIKPQNPSSGAASVVPFNTLIEGLKEKTAYSEPDFLEKVQPLARKFVDFRKEPLSIEEQFYQLGIEEKDRLSVIRSAYGKENAP